MTNHDITQLQQEQFKLLSLVQTGDWNYDILNPVKRLHDSSELPVTKFPHIYVSTFTKWFLSFKECLTLL